MRQSFTLRTQGRRKGGGRATARPPAAEARRREGHLHPGGPPRLPGLQELAWTFYKAGVVPGEQELGDEMKWAVSSGAPRVGSRTKNRKGEAAGVTEGEPNSPLWPDVPLPAFSRGPSHLAQKKACSLLAAKAPGVGITP